MLSRQLRAALQIVTAVLALSPGAAAAAATDDGVAYCRSAVARSARLLADTVVSRMVDCHDERMRGEIDAGVDCSDANDPGFPESNARAIERRAERLTSTVAAACAALSPAAAGYTACASPCDDATPQLTTFGDASACFACQVEHTSGVAVTTAYGETPLVSGARTEAWKCQHRRVGQGMDRYLGSLIRAQHRCQQLEEKGQIGDTDCAEADLTGAVARAVEQLSRSIGFCEDADLASLTSCASSVTDEQACVRSAADGLAGELFDLVYPDVAATPTPTPTPTPAPTGTAVADSCPDESFLDVSQAPGAGASYADPYLSVSCDPDEVIVQSNSIPHYTFVQTTPNALVVNNVTYRFPRYPAVTASTTAIPLLGDIAVAVNGLPIFGPNEAATPDPYGDPIANAIVDECLGHTAFIYHYHALLVKCLTASGLVSEPWLNDDPPTDEPSPIVAYAFDGFPIYGPYDCADAECSQVIEVLSSWDNQGWASLDCTSSAQCSNGYTCALSMINGVRRNACVPETYAWTHNQYVAKAGAQYLDQCNGHVGPDGDYHYHATATFPYVLGCYRGTPAN